MKRLFDLFRSELQIYMNPKHKFDPLEIPYKLLKQLDPQNPENLMSEFINQITIPQQIEGLKLMKILTLMSYIMLYSDKYFKQFDQLLPITMKCTKQDKWMYENFLCHYEVFLMKCCHSSQIYNLVKENSADSLKKICTFDTLFYIINLINKLFKSVQKVSWLARYYENNCFMVTKMYVFVAATQAIKLYSSMKTIINVMIQNHHLYLPTRQDQRVLKGILNSNLIQINEDMKELILNKYYTPCHSKIKIKLYRIQQSNDPKSAKVINGILNSHRQTDRQNLQRQAEMEFKILTSNQTQWFNNSFDFKIQKFSPQKFNLSMTASSSKDLQNYKQHKTPAQMKIKNNYLLRMLEQYSLNITKQKHDLLRDNVLKSKITPEQQFYSIEEDDQTSQNV